MICLTKLGPYCLDNMTQLTNQTAYFPSKNNCAPYISIQFKNVTHNYAV